MSDGFTEFTLLGRIEHSDGYLEPPKNLEFRGELVLHADLVHVYKTEKGRLAFHRHPGGFVDEWIFHHFENLKEAANFEKSGHYVFDRDLIQQVARSLGIDPPFPKQRLDI